MGTEEAPSGRSRSEASGASESCPTGTSLQGRNPFSNHSCNSNASNGNLEMFGLVEAKSSKSTEQFDTKLVRVGLPS